MFPTDRNFPEVGTLTAEFDNDFKFSSFEGGVNFFFHAGAIGLIYLVATQSLSDTTSNDMRMSFSPDIKTQRYDFPSPFFPFPLKFIEKWYDGDTYEKSYRTLPDVGYINVRKFDINAGTFQAEFDITIEEAGKQHRATGEIDIEKWTEVRK